MKSKTENKHIHRLDALDGLRGLAILMVFLNHIDSTYIVNIVPTFIRPLIQFVFSSGTIGVSILFILSGFLMVYIYEQPKSTIGFWQKRYTRIFPLFISMVLAMSVFHLVPTLNLLYRILVILTFAGFIHILWVYGVQKINKPLLGRVIFFGFLLFQIVIACIYLFIMRKPAIFFYEAIPMFIRESIISSVNATLTLPFGDYIPMLDGVYWSLVSEVLFYLMFPLICVPLIRTLSHRSRFIKIMFLFCLIPFFAGITLLFKRILNFQMILPFFFMYFATGICLGYMVRHSPVFITQLKKHLGIFHYPLSIFVLFFCMYLTFVHTNGPLNTWIRVLWAIPLTLAIIPLLENSTKISRFFSAKYILFLGAVSYSIYLVHTSIVDGMHLFFKPKTTVQTLMFIGITFVITLIMASIIHYLLEKPYFRHQYKEWNEKNSFLNPSVKVLAFCLFFVFLFFIFVAYQSRFNFFSFTDTIPQERITSPRISNNQKTISLLKYPVVRIQFTAKENVFGIFTAYLQYKTVGKAINENQRFLFSIRELGSNTWYATSSYIPVQIGYSELPMGFPMIQNAKGKNYEVQLTLSSKKSDEDILIDLNKPIQVVYQFNKDEFVHEPIRLVYLLKQRVWKVLMHSEAQTVILELLPIFIFLFYFVFSSRQTKKKLSSPSK